jgi:hypothetical protein
MDTSSSSDSDHDDNNALDDDDGDDDEGVISQYEPSSSIPKQTQQNHNQHNQQHHPSASSSSNNNNSSSSSSSSSSSGGGGGGAGGGGNASTIGLSNWNATRARWTSGHAPYNPNADASADFRQVPGLAEVEECHYDAIYNSLVSGRRFVKPVPLNFITTILVSGMNLAFFFGVCC